MQILRLDLRQSASWTWMWKVPAYTKDNSQIMLNHSLQILPAVLTSLWHQHGYLQLDKLCAPTQVDEGGWHRHKQRRTPAAPRAGCPGRSLPLACHQFYPVHFHQHFQLDLMRIHWHFRFWSPGWRWKNFAKPINCWRLWESWKGRRCHVQG